MFYFELSIVFILILMNGVFAMSELAIVSSKKVYLRQLAAQGNKNAQRAIEFSEDTGRFLPTVQIGITLIGVLSGAFSGATLADYLIEHLINDWGVATERAKFISVTLVVITVTYLTLIIGELVPKELALRKPEKLALFVTPVIYALSKITFPAVWFLNISSSLVLKIIGAEDKPASTVTQEEVRALIAEGATYGVFAEQEQDMLSGVMLLADKPVRAFMMPRIDVISLTTGMSAERIREIITTHDYSRFPVRTANDDNGVIGVALTKDILLSFLSNETFNLEAVTQNVTVFPENTSALKVIEYLRSSPIDIALIVDEHGSFEGIVTLTDLFSVITGEIYGMDNSSLITVREDGSWLIDGSVLIDHVFEEIAFSEKIEHTGFHTLAGFILYNLRTMPKAGDYFIFKNYRFEVVDMDGNRIDKVLIQPSNEA